MGEHTSKAPSPGRAVADLDHRASPIPGPSPAAHHRSVALARAKRFFLARSIRARLQTGTAVLLVGMLAFSGYGTLLPQTIRCALPGDVGCPGGLFGPAAPGPLAGNEQYFNVTMYDYGFWILNTVDGTNETKSWNVYEGWTVHVNATSLPPDRGAQGEAYHGLGIEINATGNQLLSLAAPVGKWVKASFVAPSQAYYHQRIWCTVYCGQGHSSQHMNNFNVVPSTVVPSVTVSANRTSGSPPLSVAFTGSISGGTAPYNTSWDFGDGSPAVATVNSTHTYTSSGNYSATLTVVDANGASKSGAVAINVAAAIPLSVSIGVAPASGVAPFLAQFTATAASGTPPYAFTWKFGDGATATGASPFHVFSAPGSFGVSVAARDSSGAVAKAVTTVTAQAASLQLTVRASSSPASGTAPLAVTFAVNSSAGSAPYTAVWLYGDGSTGTGLSSSHTYRLTGVYEAAAFVADSAGGTGMALTAVSVSGSAGASLSANVLACPSSGSPPLLADLSVSVEGGTGSYPTETWNYGDGASGSGPVVSHTYASLGIYAVSVAITDSNGAGVTGQATVEVVGFGIAIALNRSAGDAPFSVGAAATVQGGTGVYSPVTWTWGDGTTSQGSPANHTFGVNRSGPILLKATVNDSAGAKASATATVTIAPAPTAEVSATVPMIEVFPVSLNFTLSVQGGTGNFSSSPLWKFGDGSTTRGPTPQAHQFAKPGHYIVTVLTNDSLGTPAVASTDLNLSLAPLSGTSGSTPPEWIFNGVANPDQVALEMMGIFALSALVLLLISRRRRAMKRPPAGPGASVHTAGSVAHP